MKRTLIQLTGEELDIIDIQSNLRTSEWKIIKDQDEYNLTSDFLNSITDHEEIKSKVRQFLDVTNGASNIIHGNHKKVSLGAIIQIDEQGRKIISVSITESITIRSRAYGELRASGDTNVYPTTVETWLIKADKHESVRDVLHFFNEITWWNLYKVYEIIKDDLIGVDLNHKKRIIKKDIEEIFKKRGITNFNKINDFTNVAQSRELLGDSARHATYKIKVPDIGMTLNDAHAIIRNLFDEWIKMKN